MAATHRHREPAAGHPAHRTRFAHAGDPNDGAASGDRAEGPVTAADWTQILVLYDMLLHLTPSPVARLHRAVALRYVAGSARALSEVDTLGDTLDDYHLFHATRAELLRDLDRPDEANAADERALALTANPAEQSLLRQRHSWHGKLP
jgi:predicted RNA polymerase sigma factor